MLISELNKLSYDIELFQIEMIMPIRFSLNWLIYDLEIYRIFKYCLLCEQLLHGSFQMSAKEILAEAYLQK